MDNMINKIMQARAEHRVYRSMACEIEKIAIQTDCPVYKGDKEADLYVKLSDVIEVLQKNDPMDIPLLERSFNKGVEAK